MSEPVSTLQFPDNREINREFFDFGPFSGFLLPIDKQVQPLAAKFRSYVLDKSGGGMTAGRA
jgi:hypothetical protein